MRSMYCVEILRNIQKKKRITVAVMGNNHINLACGMSRYAPMPFMVMDIPGAPQMRAASIYR